MNALETWMTGWTMRQQRLSRPPYLVPGEHGDFTVKVQKDRGTWLVTVARRGVEAGKEQAARLRFHSWYIVTGDKDDVVTTETVRRDWWLAHQDVGLNVPASRRREGVESLLTSDDRITKGRGVLRGVVSSDESLDDALAMLKGDLA